ncbi:MAG: hypothetical protein OXI60_06625, partial [Acidiferrobacterales bacterium]|nr:hypothetical protein [Acidiferrobacterales bacterium]
MNAEVVSETAVRTKRTRNIVTGFVIWIGAVVAVVFVVLNPTQSVEMRPGVDNSVQPAVTVASEHSTGSDEADDAKPEVSSIVFKGSTVAAPEPVATVESAQTADVPSESETETIPDSVAVTETNVQSETEVETATVADGENRTEAEGTSGTQATEVVQSSEPAEPVQSTEV